MSIASILGGLFLLLLGICGAATCSEQCGRERPAQRSLPPAPVSTAWEKAFPERVGAWERRGEVRSLYPGAMSCLYLKGGTSCSVEIGVSRTDRVLRVFGKDLEAHPAPEGWRFLRQTGPGTYFAGYGQAWTLEEEVWITTGPAVRLQLSTADPGLALELLQALDRDGLDQALGVK